MSTGGGTRFSFCGTRATFFRYFRQANASLAYGMILIHWQKLDRLLEAAKECHHSLVI